MGAIGIMLAAGAGWLMASFIARIFVGAGIAMTTYVGLSWVIGFFQTNIDSALSGIPADMAAILSMAGFGVAFNVMVSTVSAVAALWGLGKVTGVKIV